MTSLTSEQATAVKTFSDITGNARDEQGAIELLRVCNWNVEQAVQLQLEGYGNVGGAPTSVATALSPPTPTAESLIAPLMNSGGSQPAEPPTDAPAPMERSKSVLDSLPGWAERPLRKMSDTCPNVSCYPTGCFAAISRDMKVLRASRRLPAGAVGLARQIAVTYGPELALPKFIDGSLQEALETAQKAGKSLAVYLHNSTSRYAQKFCMDTLTSDEVRNMLDTNYLLVGLDVGYMERENLPHDFRSPEQPFFCVVAPQPPNEGDREYKVQGSVHGDIEKDALVALLVNCKDEAESQRVFRRNSQIEDRLIMAEQAAEFQAALEADRQREEEKRLQEEQEREARRKEEEEAERERTLTEERELQWSLTVEARKKMASELPAQSADAKSPIALRFPQGQRLQRKFSPSATLADVYKWAECAAYLPENANKQGLEVPIQFVLRTVMPSKDLTEMESTIAELKIAGTNLVLAEIEEE